MGVKGELDRYERQWTASPQRLFSPYKRYYDRLSHLWTIATKETLGDGHLLFPYELSHSAGLRRAENEFSGYGKPELFVRNTRWLLKTLESSMEKHPRRKRKHAELLVKLLKRELKQFRKFAKRRNELSALVEKHFEPFYCACPEVEFGHRETNRSYLLQQLRLTRDRFFEEKSNPKLLERYLDLTVQLQPFFDETSVKPGFMRAKSEQAPQLEIIRGLEEELYAHLLLDFEDEVTDEP